MVTSKACLGIPLTKLTGTTCARFTIPFTTGFAVDRSNSLAPNESYNSPVRFYLVRSSLGPKNPFVATVPPATVMATASASGRDRSTDAMGVYLNAVL